MTGNFNLLHKRLEKGVTQTEVAKAVGCSPMSISYYEKGLRTPKKETLNKIAQFYGCSSDELAVDYQPSQPIIELDDLIKAASPLINFLRKKGHPHMSAIVTGRTVKIVSDIVGMPLDYDD